MRAILAAVFSFTLSIPAFAQLDMKYRSATMDGAPGLFKTWDAEPAGAGEVFFSSGLTRTHRDPGQLTITTMPAAMSVGLFNRLEVFGVWEAQKRIEADDIQYYRIAPGEPSRPATTPLGKNYFSSAAPFIDVPVAAGRGELYGRIKANILSEQRHQRFGLSIVGLGKAASHKSFGGLNRGLATGDVEVGFGVLASKRVRNMAEVYGNALFNWTGHPTIDGIGVSDLDNSEVIRVGSSFPLSSSLRASAEIEATRYYFHEHAAGLNPVNPVEIVLGLRKYAGRSVSFGGAYVASVRHVEEDAARAVHPAGTNGFIFQLGLAFRRD